MNGDVTQLRNMKVKCPFCGRWNDLDELTSGSVDHWTLEYRGENEYGLNRFSTCLYCEKEMYMDLEFSDLRVRIEGME